MKVLGIGQTVFWSRIHHNTGIYEVCELKVRTVYENSFVGVDKDSRQAHIISYDECDISVFDDRATAVAVVKEAEKRRKKFTVDKSED